MDWAKLVLEIWREVSDRLLRGSLLIFAVSIVVFQAVRLSVVEGDSTTLSWLKTASQLSALISAVVFICVLLANFFDLWRDGRKRRREANEVMSRFEGQPDVVKLLFLYFLHVRDQPFSGTGNDKCNPLDENFEWLRKLQCVERSPRSSAYMLRFRTLDSIWEIREQLRPKIITMMTKIDEPLNTAAEVQKICQAHGYGRE